MLVLTVAELQTLLTTLTTGGDPTNTPIASQDDQIGFHVWSENNTIKIVPASAPGERIGE